MLPLLGIAAYSGTGKTTLLKQLIPLLRQQGIRCGLIKHTHHDMDVDTPGKDSYELRKAGAMQTVVASQQRWALMTETPDNTEPNLYWLASRMDETTLDVILVEGFKQEPIPKIVLWRPDSSKGKTLFIDNQVIAVASNAPVAVAVPLLDLNDPIAICDFIIQWLQNQKH